MLFLWKTHRNTPSLRSNALGHVDMPKSEQMEGDRVSALGIGIVDSFTKARRLEVPTALKLPSSIVQRSLKLDWKLGC